MARRCRSSNGARRVKEIYAVEKVLDKRTTENGRVEYFIKWLGVEAKWNSWELASNSDPKKIKEFELERSGESRKRKAIDSPTRSRSLTSAPPVASSSSGPVLAKRPRGRPPKAKNVEGAPQSSAALPSAVENNSTPAQASKSDQTTAVSVDTASSSTHVGVNPPLPDHAASSSASTKKQRGRPRKSVPVQVVQPQPQPSLPVIQPVQQRQLAMMQHQQRPQMNNAPRVMHRPPSQPADSDDSDIEVVMEINAPIEENESGRRLPYPPQQQGPLPRGHPMNQTPQQRAQTAMNQARMMQCMIVANQLMQQFPLMAGQQMQHHPQGPRHPMQNPAARRPMQNPAQAARRPMKPPSAWQLMQQRPFPPQQPPMESVHSEEESSDVEFVEEMIAEEIDENEQLPVLAESEVQKELDLIMQPAEDEVPEAVGDELELETTVSLQEKEDEPMEYLDEKEMEEMEMADLYNTIPPQEQRDQNVDSMEGEDEDEHEEMPQSSIDHNPSVGENNKRIVPTFPFNLADWSARPIDWTQSLELAVRKEHLELGETVMAGTVYVGEVPFEVGVTIFASYSGEENMGIVVSCNGNEDSNLWIVDATFMVEMPSLNRSIAFDRYSFDKKMTSVDLELPISVEEVMGEGSAYLDEDGTLLLNITVTMTNMEGYDLPEEFDFTTESHTDSATIYVEDIPVFVNIDDLSIRSPLFDKLFRQRDEDEPIVVDNCTLDEFLLMLEMVFNDDCEMDNLTLIDVMHTAHLFQMTDLITKCNEYFYNHMYELSTQQVVQAMQQVDEFGDDDLESGVLEVVVRRNLFESVKETEEYMGLSTEYMMCFLDDLAQLEAKKDEEERMEEE